MQYNQFLLFHFVGGQALSLKQRHEIVMQCEIVSRLEEEKEIVLSEMEDYLLNLKKSINDNTIKLNDSDIAQGTKALLAQHVSVLHDQLLRSVHTFRRVTEGQFEFDLSPNDDTELLWHEYSETVEDVSEDEEGVNT